MRLKRTLAYSGGEIEKPNVIRRLAFTAALALPLLCSCAAHAAPDRTGFSYRAAEETRAAAEKGRQRTLQRRACGADLGGALMNGERAKEAVCRFGREYVMTEMADAEGNLRRSLIIIERPQAAEGDAQLSLRMHTTRTDMDGFAARGIADWEPTEDSVLILTKNDSTLTRIPNEGMGETVPAYVMPFDARGLGRAGMVYHSGILFIAPRGEGVIAISFSGEMRSVALPLRSERADAGFFTRGGSLVFGKAGAEETAISVNGGIDSITLRRIR